MHDNISISHRAVIVTESHNYKSKDFKFESSTVKKEDYVWIGVNVTIVGDVLIGRGAVVCAGAVVTKDIESYHVVAGIPAKCANKRPNDFNYTILEGIYPYPTFT